MLRTILIVDDDQKTRNLLKAYLEKQQYEVRSAHDGASFLAEFERLRDKLSLVILDVMLPDTDGFTLCKKVRSQSAVPIIMLTASADDTDRIVGLELGADDYIAKPYNPRELLARIKAIQRRMQAGSSGPVRYLRFRDFSMDLTERLLRNAQGERVIHDQHGLQPAALFCRACRRDAGPQPPDGADARARPGAAGPFA